MRLVGRKCRHGSRLAAVQTAVWLLLQAQALIIAQTEHQTETKAAAANQSEYRHATLGAKGEASRGRRLLEDTTRTRCATCHAIGGRGATLGPDLSGLGGGRTGVPRSSTQFSIRRPRSIPTTLRRWWASSQVEWYKGCSAR